MEQELNYLSERIESADLELIRLKQNKACLESIKAKEHYAGKIKEKEKEINLLNNILSALTINELNK